MEEGEGEGQGEERRRQPEMEESSATALVSELSLWLHQDHDASNLGGGKKLQGTGGGC